MLENIDIKKLLIIDIETASQYPDYDSMPQIWKELWDIKAGHLAKENETPAELYHRAGIYSEFGKIICITAGFFTEADGKLSLRIKSYYGDDEVLILKEFSELLDSKYNMPDSQLCAHNGKEFDYPYIARRCLINNLKIPSILDNAAKKPWEINLLDTFELWRFGDKKSYTSLNLLAAVFGIDSPKAEMDGSQVYEVYWNDKDIEKIKTYCQRDVVTLANIFLRFKGAEPMDEKNIIYTN
jgi:uncharacterized protein YprB with RNaseH-like and TPR domain